MTPKFLIENALYPKSPSAGFTRGRGGLPGEGHVLLHAAGSPAMWERLGPASHRPRSLGNQHLMGRTTQPRVGSAAARAEAQARPCRPHRPRGGTGHPVASAHLPSGC